MAADLADLALRLAAAAVAFLLPGWLVADWIGEGWTRGLRLAAGAAIGLLVVPIACFSAAWLMGTNVRPPLVVGVGVVIAVVVAGGRVAVRW
ncbi:MAG: hypothetical protein FJ087_08990, partial [Deltaproteobacteria bacterium]|nr:hypothetical protein [Deltaproteobacteria bacterium]